MNFWNITPDTIYFSLSKFEDDDDENVDSTENDFDKADLEETGDSGCCRASDALIAEENTNSEFLIGLDSSLDDDALGQLAALRSKTQLANETSKRIIAAAKRTQELASAGNDYAMELAADLATLLAQHKPSLFGHAHTGKISGHRSRSTGD